MNLVGKIFVVLILVMSLVFMSFAMVIYATHTNWKTKAETADKSLKNVEDQLKKAEAEWKTDKKALDEKIDEQAETIRAYVTEERRLKNDITEQKEQLNLLNAQTRSLSESVSQAHESLGKSQAEVETLSNKLLDSQRNWASAHARYIEQTDKANTLAVQLAKFRSVGAQLAKDYGDAVAVLRMHKLKPDPILYAGPPKGIQGTVTEVGPNGWVEISIGEDSGILVGHKLDIVRNVEGRSSYIARIKVERTEPDRAAASIIPESRRGYVQREDGVEYIDTYEFSAK